MSTARIAAGGVMPSREHAGRRRDFYLERVDKTLSGVELDALDLRKGMLDALDAARWAAGADGRDDRIAELLQWAGQLGVALLESIRGRALPVPYRGNLITVPIGLPLEGLHAGQWAETLFAATAAQDAPSAVRLSRVQVDA